MDLIGSFYLTAQVHLLYVYLEKTTNAGTPVSQC